MVLDNVTGQKKIDFNKLNIEDNDKQQKTEQEQQANHSKDNFLGKLTNVPILGKILPDLLLSEIFRKSIALFQDSPEKQKIVSGLFFGSSERRLAFISKYLSPEIANELRVMKDLKKRQEIEAVMIVGIVDPDPKGPLSNLLGMLGGLQFPESISIALGKIASLNDLAQHLLQIAAKEGKRDEAKAYEAAIGKVGSDSKNLSSSIREALIYSAGKIKDALTKADEVNKKKELTKQAENIEQQIPNADVSLIPGLIARKNELKSIAKI